MIISEEELEFNAIFKSNKKHIYWKLTEDGLVYCSRNCLLISNYIKQNFDFFPQIDFQATSTIVRNEKNQFYNKSNTRENLDSIPNLITYSNEFNVDFGEIYALNCSPYTNHTNYDFLKSFSKRDKLIGIPEPDLITMFDRNSKVDLETLRQQLIELKKEVSFGYFLKEF